MNITKQEVEQAFADYGTRHYGCKEDYFALLYLAKKFERPIEDIAHQVSFGNNDYGFDAFYVDTNLRNLYLFQFKWSENHKLFKESFERLISSGMQRVFGATDQDQKMAHLLLHLKQSLTENKAAIDHVLIHFVFNGSPEDAEQSAVLDSLKEDLESKKYLLAQFFGDRPIDLTIQFISNDPQKPPPPPPLPGLHKYRVTFDQRIFSTTSSGETLHVGFIALMDLYAMYCGMGLRFFERNIRAGLSAEKPPNRAIRQTLTKMVLKGQEPSDAFVFNHNGVTLAVEHVEFDNNQAIITEPRLLNGAQTVTSLAKFLEVNKDNKALKDNELALQSIRVLAKVISSAKQDFVLNATICNNRQNPVEPWNLRANDLIQLEFEEKFRENLKIFYERQENAFKKMSDEDLEERGIEQYKAIAIRPLAQTFLALQGEIDKMSRLRDVFEDQKIYEATFRSSYLPRPASRILLAYKVQFRLNRIAQEIVAKSPYKYQFIGRARNLIWALLIQGILNDSKLPNLCERFGTRFVMEADFSEYLKDLGSQKVRLVMIECIKDVRYKQMILEEKYSFLRTKATYQRCMDIAQEKYAWQKKSF